MKSLTEIMIDHVIRMANLSTPPDFLREQIHMAIDLDFIRQTKNQIIGKISRLVPLI